jgi:hypothetical protein
VLVPFLVEFSHHFLVFLLELAIEFSPIFQKSAIELFSPLYKRHSRFGLLHIHPCNSFQQSCPILNHVLDTFERFVEIEYLPDKMVFKPILKLLIIGFAGGSFCAKYQDAVDAALDGLQILIVAVYLYQFLHLYQKVIAYLDVFH